MSEYIEVRSTIDSKEGAERIASTLIESRLVSCAQICSPIQSTYWWQGKIEHAQEYLLLMKTTRDQFDRVAQMIRDNHPYDVPDIVAVSIAEGIGDYLRWISEETRGHGEPR